MRVDGPRGKLYDAHKTLRLRWEEAQTIWTDHTAKDFEADVWIPLDSLCVEMARGIDRLSQVFLQMKHDCQGE